MTELECFLAEHRQLTRRYFLRLGSLGAAAVGVAGAGILPQAARGEAPSPELADAIAKLEPYFTPPDKFRDVSRGRPIPHKLPEAKKREVGLTRETWRLEVVSDPEKPAKIRKPMTKADGTALDFAGLMELGKKRAVRFAKVMTCLNIGCPLGMGIWEGVPLREVVWRTDPREDLRRVFYYGYHNDDPKQMFRSSLPVGRVLEDYGDLPPVILCYKLNGQWLSAERGGPVRIVVPEAYGFKCIKWLTHVVLSNLPGANDTYAGENNDVDSPLKSFAATLSVPQDAKAGQPIPVTGYAQAGISGVKKVQVWVHPSKDDWPSDDPYYAKAPWRDAEILPPPVAGTLRVPSGERGEETAPGKTQKKDGTRSVPATGWGGELPEGKIPSDTLGFDAAGRPRTWPMRLAKVHWAVLLPGLPKGEYALHCRTIDEQGQAQPLPRPFRKSGHAAIEEVPLKVI
jgi:DMSO/TMAO reductase YedYZ molybdopterin-dependent catalytic subunit